MSDDHRVTAAALREYADALDKDRGHDRSSVTRLMRKAADLLEIERQFNPVRKVLLGRVLMQLDRIPPVQNLRTNQEYAPPGTARWVAETVALLQELADA